MRLGEKQKLTVVKKLDFGVYLAENLENNRSEERVLLPMKEVLEGTQIGDEIEVFLYKDSKDRLIATTATPAVVLGGFAKLKVTEVGKIGAFLDWGLPKELFLPFREQTYRVAAGDEVVVGLYIDKSGRLAATMKLYHYLKTDSPYHAGDDITGVIYEISDNFGAFVVVDDRYSGRIPKKEFAGEAKCGDTIRGRVTRVLEDGKLDISIRDKAYAMIEPDSEAVLEALSEYGGVLPFTDKSDPEIIKHEMSMSKAAFKRAVGHLLKAGRIELDAEHKIRLKK